jgi:ATP-dependent Clp protease ATP-binding subunit ClpB
MMRITPQALDPSQTGLEAQALENRLRSKIIGQDEAIKQVVDVYQTSSLGLSAPGRPVGSFLFLGPTGSGKTRFVEAVAESLVHSAKAVIKIDCGEFQHSHEIAKLIGSPPGYLGHRETQALLTQENLDAGQTKRVKLSFVLFDEIEKASDALWNLLLGILDKGTLTLGDNRHVDFSRAMIFMTGNVGAAEAAQALEHRFGFGAFGTPQRTEPIVTAAAGRQFSPEFLNRIDRTVVFRALGEPELRRILDLELRAMRRRLARRTRFALSLTEPAKGHLLRQGIDIRYGARHLKRAIERSLVHPISNLMATGQVRRGDSIGVDLDSAQERFVFYRCAENMRVKNGAPLSQDEIKPEGTGLDPDSAAPPKVPHPGFYWMVTME